MIMTTITGDYRYGKYSIMMNNAKQNHLHNHHPTHLRHSSPTLNLIDPDNNSFCPLTSDEHNLPEEVGQHQTTSCSSSYYYYGNDIDIEHDYTINYPANERKSIINSARNNYIENNNNDNDNSKAQRKASIESLLFEIKEPIKNDQLWNKRCDEPINPQPCDLLTSDQYEKIYQQLLKHFSRKINFSINTGRPNDLSNNMAGINLESIPNNYSDEDPHTWPSNWQSQAPSMILAPENYLSKKPTLNEYQRRLIRRIALKYEPLFHYYREKILSNEIGTEPMLQGQTSSTISASQPLKTFSNYSSPDSSSCSLSSYSGHEDDNLDYSPTAFNNNLNAKSDIETAAAMSSTMNNKHINTNLTKTMAMLKDYTGNDCLNINHPPLIMTKSSLKPFSYQNLDNIISKNNSKTDKHYQQQQQQQQSHHNPDPYTFNVIANCNYTDEEIINQRQHYELSPMMIVTGGNGEEEDSEENVDNVGDDEIENDANNRFIDGHIMITSSKPIHMNRNIGHREFSGSSPIGSSPMSLMKSTKMDSIRNNKKSNYENHPSNTVVPNCSSSGSSSNTSKMTPIHHLHKWSAKMKDYLKKNN